MDKAVKNPLNQHFGIELYNVKLLDFLSNTKDNHQIKEEKANEVTRIIDLVHRHKVVVFREQGVLDCDAQLGISRWFGEIEDYGFDQHERSPHRCILRVSNDENEGFRHFGTAGFHIDGSFMEKPNAYSIYHIIQNPKVGGTAFVSLSDIYNEIPDQQKRKWERLWMIKIYKRIHGFRESPGFVIHPTCYEHPVTGQKAMCLAQGKTSRFIWDWGLNVARRARKEDTTFILEEINEALAMCGEKYQYHHKWQDGDLIMTDNLAVAHLALPDTQLPAAEAGLRVMHRTVIKGTNRPWKDPQPPLLTAIKCGDVPLDEIDIEDIELENHDTVLSHSFGDESKMQNVMRNLQVK